MKDGKIQTDVGTANQPRMLFKPGSWLAKIDFINHLVLFNNVLITLLSEKEGGKTSFSTLLQNNLDQQIKSIFMTAEPPCDEKKVITDIAAQLHLNVSSETNLLSLATQINERKAHVLIIIDNAQHLPESFIKEAMIAIKNQNDFGFFHLCLVSDYSVVATLNKLAIDQYNNLIHTIELGSLNESETRTYVLQRAMVSGLIHRPLTEVQFKQFYQLTKGNLAKINNNLESFIQKCPTQEGSNKKLTLKRTTMAISAAVAVGVSYLYFSGIYDAYRYPEITKLTTLPAIENIVGDIKSIQPLVSYIASWEDSSTRQFVHYALPKKQNLDDLEDLDNEEEHFNTVAIVDKVIVIPTVKARKELVEFQLPVTQIAAIQQSKAVNIGKITPNQVASKSDLVATQSPVTQTAAIQQSNVVKIGKITPKKVASKPGAKKSASGQYTIQLVASHRASDIHRFRTSNKLFANTKVRHFTNETGSWYILTLGEFDSRSVAQLKSNKLPPELAKLKPWIRSVSGLSNIG